MPQIENTELLDRILKSTLSVIGRRTSEPYAKMIVGGILKKLSSKYVFLNLIKIEKDSFKEDSNLLDIDEKVNNVEFNLIADLITDLMITLANQMGKDAGFYFIKEIKEDIPYNYEIKIKDAGVNLEYIQSKFLTEIKSNFRYSIENHQVVKYVFSLIYQIIEDDFGKKYAFETLSELILRLSTQYDMLRYVKINDVTAVQNVDIITVSKDIDRLDEKDVGLSVQKIVQEISNDLSDKKSFSLIKKLKSNLSLDYSIKLQEMDVNFEVIKLKQSILVKKIIKTILDVLSFSSSESYAVLILNNVIKSHSIKYGFLNFIQIDTQKLTKGIDAINIPDEFNNISPSELGRSIQRIMEKLITTIGEEAARTFLDRFKSGIGKPVLVRMEEIGVNLHMIELRQNFL